MAEDEDRSGEGLSTTTKIVAGTAIGVAVPAAVAAGRKLMGGDNGREQRPKGSPGAARSGAQQASTRPASTKRGSSTRTSNTSRPGSTAKTRSSSASSRTSTREQLYAQAKRLKIEGRSRMTKAQLERAVARSKK